MMHLRDLNTFHMFALRLCFSVCNIAIFTLWGSKADSYLQGIHLSWNVGMFIMPMIVQPFLGAAKPPHYENETTMLPLHTTDPMDQNMTAVKTSRIEIPYAIIGAIAYVLAVILLVSFFVGSPKTLNTNVEQKESY